MFNSTFSHHFTSLLRQFNIINNGKYIAGKYDNQDSVEIMYKGYKIVFDSIITYHVVSGNTSENEFSRVRLEFNSPDKLKLKLVNQGLLENIQKFFGTQDILTSNKEFDSKFLIQGTDELKVKALFEDPMIQDYILSLRTIRLDIFEGLGFFEEKIRQGNSVLYFTLDEEIKDLNYFNLLLDTFKALINKLEMLGSATPLARE